MEKRVFEVLDEMNQDDIKNNTRLVAVGNAFVAAEKVKAGCTITMGMPINALSELMDDSKIPLLVLVDKKEYFKRKKNK